MPDALVRSDCSHCSSDAATHARGEQRTVLTTAVCWSKTRKPPGSAVTVPTKPTEPPTTEPSTKPPKLLEGVRQSYLQPMLNHFSLPLALPSSVPLCLPRNFLPPSLPPSLPPTSTKIQQRRSIQVMTLRTHSFPPSSEIEPSPPTISTLGVLMIAVYNPSKNR